ncbi:hypothetical protein BDR03DRAFT_967967 [Suillus americanus]|nr:hypothetical protein BDR03DRAFT_967967 [Suillus americanus]
MVAWYLFSSAFQTSAGSETPVKWIKSLECTAILSNPLVILCRSRKDTTSTLAICVASRCAKIALDSVESLIGGCGSFSSPMRRRQRLNKDNQRSIDVTHDK